MKLISLNIELDRHYDLILPFFEQEKPDAVCLQEVLEEDFLLLKEKISMDGFWKPMKYITSKGQGGPLDKKWGVALFAHNIQSTGYAYYVGTEANTQVPFEEFFARKEGYFNHPIIWAEVTGGSGKTFKIATTHFLLTEGGESTPVQLEALDSLLRELDKLGEFVLVGDMNAPRGRETFTRLAQKYTDNIPLKYETSLDQKLHKYPGLMLMVDGLFTTPNYKASNVRLVDGLSDHMAIVATVEKE